MKKKNTHTHRLTSQPTSPILNPNGYGPCYELISKSQCQISSAHLFVCSLHTHARVCERVPCLHLTFRLPSPHSRAMLLRASSPIGFGYFVFIYFPAAPATRIPGFIAPLFSSLASFRFAAFFCLAFFEITCNTRAMFPCMLEALYDLYVLPISCCLRPCHPRLLWLSFFRVGWGTERGGKQPPLVAQTCHRL